MKKLLFISAILLVSLGLQNCKSDEEGHENDGEIEVTVLIHDEASNIENPAEGAAVEMWFNASSPGGTADFSGTTDATGLVIFEELESGIYFIQASATVESTVRTGTALAEVSEAEHDVHIEIDLD